MSETLTIELFKEDMKFSAGHFTIFSAEDRENLHGHNFSIYVALTGNVNDNGLMADYGIFKRELRALCDRWDETLLLPANSPHLRLELDDPKEIRAYFADEILRFLPRDVTVLPVRNVTIEELAYHYCQRVIELDFVAHNSGIEKIQVKCSSAPGQWACSNWSRKSPGSEDSMTGEQS